MSLSFYFLRSPSKENGWNVLSITSIDRLGISVQWRPGYSTYVKNCLEIICCSQTLCEEVDRDVALKAAKANKSSKGDSSVGGNIYFFRVHPRDWLLLLIGVFSECSSCRQECDRRNTCRDAPARSVTFTVVVFRSHYTKHRWQLSRKVWTYWTNDKEW